MRSANWRDSSSSPRTDTSPKSTPVSRGVGIASTNVTSPCAATSLVRPPLNFRAKRHVLRSTLGLRGRPVVGQVVLGVQRRVAQRWGEVRALSGLIVAVVGFAQLALAGVGLGQSFVVAMEFAHGVGPRCFQGAKVTTPGEDGK